VFFAINSDRSESPIQTATKGEPPWRSSQSVRKTAPTSTSTTKTTAAANQSFWYTDIRWQGAPGRSKIPALLATGYRVITYDRRGFGNSSQPWTGYNADTFAEDLHALVTKLGLHNFVLGGHSMGGEEVARYVGKYGTKNLSKAIFISAVPPFLLKTPDNPEGVDVSVFEGIKKAIIADRPALLK